MAVTLTYTINEKTRVEGGYTRVKATIVSNTGTYDAAGIPVAKASLGLPNEIRSLKIIDEANANAQRYKWDDANSKIRIYVDDGVSGIPAEASGSITAFTAVVEAVGW